MINIHFVMHYPLYQQPPVAPTILTQTNAKSQSGRAYFGPQIKDLTTVATDGLITSLLSNQSL